MAGLAAILIRSRLHRLLNRSGGEARPSVQNPCPPAPDRRCCSEPVDVASSVIRRTDLSTLITSSRGPRAEPTNPTIPGSLRHLQPREIPTETRFPLVAVGDRSPSSNGLEKDFAGHLASQWPRNLTDLDEGEHKGDSAQNQGSGGHQIQNSWFCWAR